jgi:hypothetical protein
MNLPLQMIGKVTRGPLPHAFGKGPNKIPLNPLRLNRSVLSVIWPVDPLDDDLNHQVADFMAELSSVYSELSGGDELFIKDARLAVPTEVVA